MDLITSNSGNTWDLTINNYIKLYTSTKNDSITVDYGDSSQQTILINSSKLYKNYYLKTISNYKN